MNDVQYLNETFIGNKAGDYGVSTMAMLSKLKEYHALMDDQQYILIEYVKQFIAAANVTLLYEATEAGFESGRNLHNMCRNIIDNKGISRQEGPYHIQINLIRDKIMAFPNRQIQLDLCYLALADMYFENAYALYRAEQEKKLIEFADVPKIQGFYKHIQLALGEQGAGQLQSILFETLVDVPVMRAFRQGWINEYLYSMSNEDKQSGKPVYQLWIENF